MKCFDVVNEVVEEASGQFGHDYGIVPERLEILKQYCEVIDMIAADTEAESFEAEIVEPGMTVKISMECAAFQLESTNHPFYALAKRAVSFGFEANKEGNVVAYLEFPRLWESIGGDDE